MIQFVYSLCEKYQTIAEVYLHVQTSNAEALGFYEHHGFVVKDEVVNYYKNIEQRNAYLLTKKIKG